MEFEFGRCALIGAYSMSYGFEIQSGLGSLLIDGNHTAVRKIGTHTVTAGTWSAIGGGIASGSLTVGGEVGAYIALTDDSRFHCVSVKPLSGGGCAITVHVRSGGATTINVTLVAPIQPSAAGAGAYGMEVFSDGGLRRFSTNVTNIASIGDVWLPLPSGSALNSVTISVPSGRSALISAPKFGLGWIFEPINAQQGYVYACLFRKASATVIEYQFYPIADGPPISFDTRFANFIPLFLT